MPKLLVFDMDGTVIDSMPTLETTAVNLIQEHYQISEHSARRFYNDTVGKPFREQLDHCFQRRSEKNAHVAELYEQRHEALCPSFQLCPDFEFALMAAVSRGFSTALVSSTEERFVRRIPSVIALPWSSIWGRTDANPKIRQIECAMHAACYRPKDTIYFGDTHFDLRVAQLLGLEFHLVRPETTAKQVLQVINSVLGVGEALTNG